MPCRVFINRASLSVRLICLRLSWLAKSSIACLSCSLKALLSANSSGRWTAGVSSKVEHPFLYVKRHFGYAKVRYRGLAKNTQRLTLLLGLTNLITADRYVVA